ncbi:hypothetical protein ACIOFV_15150 [Streptomyces mirabilis]|uniref:hypothetical protein n=1 Tax=Streptomyces mirabilis TaxID=68239 RepID=UPI00380DF1CC
MPAARRQAVIGAPGSCPVRGDPLAVGAQQCALPLGGRRPAGAARHDCAFARASSFSAIPAAELRTSLALAVHVRAHSWAEADLGAAGVCRKRLSDSRSHFDTAPHLTCTASWPKEHR